MLVYPQLVAVLLFLCHAHKDGVEMAEVVANALEHLFALTSMPNIVMINR